MIVFFILLVAGAALSDEDCTRDSDILRKIFQNGVGEDKPDVVEPLIVEVAFTIQKLNIVPKTSLIRIDGVLSKRWKDPALHFAQEKPCSQHISLARRKDNFWVPEISFVNGEDLILHRHSVVIDLLPNGTVAHSQRVEQNVECRSSDGHYPFGNTTCTVVWRSDLNAIDSLQLLWDPVAITDQPTISTQDVGDLQLSLVDFDARHHHKGSAVHDELMLTLEFTRTTNRMMFIFFLPSVLFIMISWLSLLLGPMAITRAVFVVGSMILLQLHYAYNVAGFPETSKITAIDLWKMFSFFMVFACLIELVCVTCMASAGRTRSSCRGRSHKGRYELEPLYEELNDLRRTNTNSRRMCRCCRYSALVLDTLSFFGFALVFLVFVFFYHTKSSEMVRWLSGVSFDNLEIPSYFK